MTEPKKYWLTDGQDNYALVAGAAERDRLVPLGWTETDEPTEGFVYVWHEGIAKPGLAPVSLLDLHLAANGWVAGPPEGADHPLDTPAPADEPPAKSTAKTTAAGGNEKG